MMTNNYSGCEKLSKINTVINSHAHSCAAKPYS